MSKYSIIIGDDTPEVRDVYDDIFSEAGFEYYFAQDGRSLLQMYKEKQVDLIIMDTLDSEFNRMLKYPEVILILRQINPDVKIIFVSGLNVDPKEFEKRFKVPFLEKPFSPETLFKNISEMIKDL